MASSQRSSDPQKVLEEIEKERKEMEEMFTIKAGMAEKLREQEVKCKLMFFSERKSNNSKIFVVCCCSCHKEIACLMFKDLKKSPAVK